MEINESYLTNEKEDLSKYVKRSEIRDFKMLARIEKYLIKNKMRFGVDGECYVFSKEFGKGVSKLYLWVSEGTYCVGPYEATLETTHLQETINFIQKWLQK